MVPRGEVAPAAVTLPSPHTERMRGRILAVLRSDDPGITPAARAAAAAALSDPASLSDGDIAALSEALARSAAGSGGAPGPPDRAS